MDRFDVFLSHTWKTSGRLKMGSIECRHRKTGNAKLASTQCFILMKHLRKYWALLLRSAWPTVILSWCILSMLAAMLTAAGVLPAMTFYMAAWQNSRERLSTKVPISHQILFDVLYEDLLAPISYPHNQSGSFSKELFSYCKLFLEDFIYFVS